MRTTDIVIVGAGLAGSTAGALLARAGIDAVLVDPHPVYPPDFRCEKIDGSQVALLRKAGLADAILGACARDRESWVVQLGHLVERRPSDQYGILYGDLVKTMRAQVPESGSVAFVQAKAMSIVTTDDRQTVSLSNGEVISARLVVLANGLNASLRQSLGMEREVISPCHSVTIGFNVQPAPGKSFPFTSLSYFAEKTSDRVSYLTLFPVADGMRANFMVYRDIHDPWFDRFRAAPRETMLSVMRNLDQMMGEFEVTGHIKIRPADLYVTHGVERPGIVLVGDAFATSCPAAGTGTTKVYNDVERLCQLYIPRWLRSEGMGAEKIAEFYADPDKVACDARCLAKAYSLRSLMTDASLYWRVQRWGRFAFRKSAHLYRQARARLGSRAAEADAFDPQTA